MIDKAGAQYELAFVVLLEIEAVFGFSRNGNLIIDSILHATAEVQTKGRHRLTAIRYGLVANIIVIVVEDVPFIVSAPVAMLVAVVIVPSVIVVVLPSFTRTAALSP